MRYTPNPICGSFLIDLNLLEDERGFFSRLACQEEFLEKGLEGKIVQLNDSYSRYKGTLRGLHYQLPPFEETKIVRCIRGSIWDVVVDLRPHSNTFCRWFGHTLTEENRTMLYIPKGCAHGFITLEDNTEILYLVSEKYSKEKERGVRWDDPAFSISWPLEPRYISEKDRNHPLFSLKKGDTCKLL
jgi:dTDP-4-dehydrorhamnose 3,5-epimerase